MPATYPAIERLLRPVEPEVRSRELTQAEKAQAFLEEQLAKITSRERARRLSMTAFGGAESGIPGGMGAVDFVPFLGSAKGLEEGVRDVNQAAYDLEAGRYGSALRNYGASALGMLPGAAGTLRAAPAVGRAAVDLAKSPTAERALGRLAEATGAGPMYAVPKDYRGSHTAPGPDYGAPLHDVSSGGMYPSDFYGPNGRQYYGNEGWDFDANAFNKVLYYKNKPDAKVTIYRAVPKSVHKEAMKSESPIKQLIQPGDWITLSKEYAKAHGEKALNNDYKIVQKMVPARQVWTNADSIHEWGYHPDTPKETGALTREAPQDEALRLAQQRAALPPAQGGLGLPANNTPMDRAKAMGNTTPAYHSTKQNPTVLLPRPPVSSRRGVDFGVHVGTNPETANGAIIPPWHERVMRDQATRTDLPESIRESSLKDLEGYYNQSQVIPLLVNTGKSLEVPDFGRWNSSNNMLNAIAESSGEWPNYVLKRDVKTNDPDALNELIKKSILSRSEENSDDLHKQAIENILKERGYGSIAYPNSIEGSGDISLMFVNPDRIRSRFAAFDPWRRDAATAAAFGVAAPDLLAKEKTEEPPKKKKKPEGALPKVTQ